jgi:3-oxoacyl-[acyl-carrier protein] reductase
MKLDGAIALVTGAGRGIGKAIALTLARNGATTILTARSLKELEAVRDEITGTGGHAHAIRTDLTNESEIDNLFKEISSRFSRLDVLINNAGLGVFSKVRELSTEDFDLMWRLNMRAVFLCSKRAIPLLEQKRSGVIVNIASLAGKNAFVGGAGYSATKWGLIGFSRTLMLEVRELNIRVITICPGSVDTSFSSERKDRERSEQILHPQDVADTVLAAILLPGRAMVSEIDIRPTNPK